MTMMMSMIIRSMAIALQPSFSRGRRNKQWERENCDCCHCHYKPWVVLLFISRFLFLCEKGKHKLCSVSSSVAREEMLRLNCTRLCVLCVYVCVCSILNCVLSVRSSTGRSIIPPHHWLWLVTININFQPETKYIAYHIFSLSHCLFLLSSNSIVCRFTRLSLCSFSHLADVELSTGPREFTLQLF